MTTQADIVKYRHAAENFNFLKCSGYPQHGALIWFELIDPFLIEMDISLLRPVKTIDTVQHYGLAGTVGADYGMNLPFLYFQADTGQGLNFPEAHMNVVKFQENVLRLSFNGICQYTLPFLEQSC